MKYVVMFEDQDEMSGMRAKHMDAHLRFLAENAALVDAAGPLSEPSSGSGAGGMWVVTAESEEQVMSLVRGDPFWPTGLRKSVRVLAWKVVHPQTDPRV